MPWVSLLEREPRTDARNERRHHAGCIAERRTRREIGASRRGGIQQVEHIEIDADPPTSAQAEILVRPEVEDVEGRKALCAVRFEANRCVAISRDRRTAVRIRRSENIRALPLDAGPALEEAGNRHVVWLWIGSTHIAGPGPRFIQREELVVRILEDSGQPAMILDRKIRDLPHPSV